METKSKFAQCYDAEFKRNAVALVQSGRSIGEVCRDLGCSSWSLGRWVAIEKCAGALTETKTLAAETPEQRELRRLRQDNDYLRRQGTYDCVDRIVLNAYFPMGQSGVGLRTWWRQLHGEDTHLDNDHLRQMAVTFSHRLTAYCAKQ